MQINCDVAIIGGGPGGSTCGGILARYAPHLDVQILEREAFPREHIGESQLPPISLILQELGCWDDVERANFPIKIGATYRWGHSDKLWDFEFMPLANYREEQRPRKFSAQARQLAFQVDRAIYDDILLRNAQRLGCKVQMPAGVRTVEMDGDRVSGLLLDDGRRVQARHYIDASGNAAVLRRAAGVAIDAPTKLQNIAFWDYWDNTEWASRHPGGATRVLVMSIGSGWIWFIPMGPTRTSIGFVCPRDYYSASGKRPEELYLWALAQEPLIAQLTANASRDGQVRGTKDWSYVADRVVGENWFMVGEAAGFADPILAAGMTLTQTSARECAYTIIALERGEHEPGWLRRSYDENQRTRVRQHIRFADFWYSANGIFTDLQAYTSEIARDAGLELSPQKAFQWLGTGGFTDDVLGQVGIGGLDLAGARQVAQRMIQGDYRWKLSEVNRFWLATDGVERTTIPAYVDGKVHAVPCLRRAGRRLPLCGLFERVANAVEATSRLSQLLPRLEAQATLLAAEMLPELAMQQLLQALEVMVSDGWIRARLDPKEARLQLGTPYEGRNIHSNQDLAQRLEQVPASRT